MNRLFQAGETRARWLVFLPVLALLVCVRVSHPVMELGLNDDWSYVWSARDLAQTGHVHYNGWATAMLGWQLYLGALFVRAFGFSFTVVRSSMLPVSAATVMLLQRLLVRVGVRPWNATLGTLTLAVSPLYLPLAFSFMTDVPGLLCTVGCLYLCVRAVQAETDRAAAIWLVVAALSNVLGGTVRQIAWLGVLVMVPSTAWFLRRRRGVLAAGGASWLVGLVAIWACLRWFRLQPYALVEKTIALEYVPGIYLAQARLAFRATLALLLFLLPVLLGFVWRFRIRSRWAAMQGVVASVVLAIVTAMQFRHGINPTMLMAPFLGNGLDGKGMLDLPTLPGVAPDLFSGGEALALGLLCLAGLGCVAITRMHDSRAERDQPEPTVTGEALAYVLGPFTAAYVVLLLTREYLYDRYLLTLLVVGLLVLLRWYEREYGERLPWITAAAMVLFAWFGVAGTHDFYAQGRARLAAVEELRAAGVPRREVRAGFDFDAWTELELSGYVNDRRLVLPAGAYRAGVPYVVPLLSPAACRFWFADHTPSITTRYGLVREGTACFPLAGLSAVTYRTWLGPRVRRIEIERLP